METLIYRDRKGSNCLKWDYPAGQFSRQELTPLWVADMDFAAPACVRQALAEQAEFGVFGYPASSEGYYQAFLDWQRKWHGVELQRDRLRYTPGVVAGFYWFVQLLSQPGEAVLIQPPVYYPFRNAVKDTGRRLVTNELVNSHGVYTIDFDDFERKIVDEQVKVFLLCSPHNPAGRVWKRAELERMLSICRAHGVRVIADEIHQDFVYPGHVHTPAAAIPGYEDMVVSLTAPSKTFNLAGLKMSVATIPDPELRGRFDEFVGRLRLTDGSLPGIAAATAAYNGGRDWLDAILETVQANYRCLQEILLPARPKVVLSPLEGTYLAWLDLGAYVAPEGLTELVEGRCGLAADYGRWFGGSAACHIRLNLATKQEIIADAARRLADAL